MTSEPARTGPGSKPRQNREARQQHILEAALRCVRRAGFHGASMADIAAEAKMSVGIIYRYFANKEALIEAIVAQDLAKFRAQFAEWSTVPDERLLDTVIDILNEAIEQKYNPDNAGIALEVLAEAARNPRVAAIVSKVDLQERALGRALSQRINPSVDPADIEIHDEIIAMLFEGMMVRAVSNPHIDRKKLLAALRPLVRVLFAFPESLHKAP